MAVLFVLRSFLLAGHITLLLPRRLPTAKESCHQSQSVSSAAIGLQLGSPVYVTPIKIGSLATFTKSASHVIELVQPCTSALMVKWVFSLPPLVQSQWTFALVPLLLSPAITSNEKRKDLLVWKQEKKQNIHWRHAVPAFSASEPCSCSQVDLTWFLFDIQGCSGFTERGWVSQVMTAKWEMHTLPLSDADLDQIQAAQSDPIWATPGEHSWLSVLGSVRRAAISRRLWVGVFWEPCTLVALLWSTLDVRDFILYPVHKYDFYHICRNFGLHPASSTLLFSGPPPPRTPHFPDIWMHTRLPDCKVISTQKILI